MKHFKIVFRWACALVFLQPTNGFSQVNNDSVAAMKYNDLIITEQSKVARYLTLFSNSFSPEEISNSYTILKDLQDVAAKAEEKIKAMDSFNGETDLKDAAIALFSFYNAIVHEEYVDMYPFLKKEVLSVSEQNHLNAVAEAVTEKEGIVDAAFQEAQKAFAARHNFTLK